MEASQHVLAWHEGPFSEAIANLDYVWIGSEGPFIEGMASEPMESCEFCPAVGEPFMDVDWRLLLCQNRQKMLFERITNEFDVSTAIVPTQMKKKYRMKDVGLRPRRNVIALYAQLLDFLKTRLPEKDVTDMTARITKGNTTDADFFEPMRLKPKRVGASMLASQRDIVLRDLKDREKEACAGIQDSLLAVRQAKFNHFKSCLVQDWQQIMAVKGALRILATKLHIKRVDWLRNQSIVGTQAVEELMQLFMNIVHQPRMELFPAIFHDMLQPSSRRPT